MIRAFARWLFMRTHRVELVYLARTARAGERPMPNESPTAGLSRSARAVGICDALETLGFLE